MLGAIKYGLTNLLNPHGRDSRQTFWYYVLFLYLLGLAVSMVVMLPIIVEVMTSTFEEIRANARDPGAVQAQTMTMMVAMMRPLVWLSIVIGIGNMVLLAASLIRRLHDSDLSGYWALLPAGAQVLALALLPGSLDRMLAVMQQAAEIQQRTANPFAMQSEMMGAQGFTGLIGWVPLLLVISIGIRDSTRGPNRFGDTAVDF